MPDRKAYAAAYYEKNAERLKARASERHRELSPVEKWEKTVWQVARGTATRSGSGRAEALRLNQRTPQWNDAQEIFRMYVAAAVMTELTGQPYVVDHIVPLASPLVSGLHCPANLEVVRKPENQMKSNLFWPQMGCVSWENWVQLRDFLPELQEDPFQRAKNDEKPAPEPAPVRRRRVAG